MLEGESPRRIRALLPRLQGAEGHLPRLGGLGLAEAELLAGLLDFR